MRPIVYLDLEDIVELDAAIRGATARAPMSWAALESAVGTPRQTVGGHDAYPTLFDKAYALGRGIAYGHPFDDGNKRLAWAAIMLFLSLNGLDVAVQRGETAPFVSALACGELDRSAFVEWLRPRSRPLYSAIAASVT
jgi:death-on-curing protein